LSPSVKAVVDTPLKTIALPPVIAYNCYLAQASFMSYVLPLGKVICDINGLGIVLSFLYFLMNCKN